MFRYSIVTSQLPFNLAVALNLVASTFQRNVNHFSWLQVYDVVKLSRFRADDLAPNG